jgi:hypothetical protein
MKASRILLGFVSVIFTISQSLFAYPPAVGILGKSKSCLSCHGNNGPWADDQKTIIDILDKETMKSLLQPDGTFLLEVRRGEKRTFLTVIGRTKDDDAPPPYLFLAFFLRLLLINDRMFGPINTRLLK